MFAVAFWETHIWRNGPTLVEIVATSVQVGPNMQQLHDGRKFGAQIWSKFGATCGLMSSILGTTSTELGQGQAPATSPMQTAAPEFLDACTISWVVGAGIPRRPLQAVNPYEQGTPRKCVVGAPHPARS